MGLLLRRLGSFSIGPIAGAAIGFITVPIITRMISTGEYGRTSMFLLAMNTLSMIIYLGMDQAFVREFNENRTKLGRLFGSAVAVPFGIALALLVLIALFRPEVSVLLFDEPDETLTVYALGVAMPFMVIRNFTLLLIRMHEQGGLYSALTISLKLFNFIFTMVLLFGWERSFRSVVLAEGLAEVLLGLLCLIIAKKYIPKGTLSFDRVLAKQMLRFGIPLVPASLMVWVLSSSDQIMLRFLYTYAELGLYTAAFKIVNVISIAQSCFTLFWTPLAYRWYEEKVDRSNFETVGRIVAVFMTIISIGLLLFKDIVAVILGEDFAAAVAIFPFLLMHPVMYTISECTAVGMGFMRKTKYNIYISAIAAASNIAMNFLLIPSFGARGAAIATGLSFTIFFWARTLFSRRLWYKFPLRDYVIATIFCLANCLVHTFLTGPAPYLFSAVSLAVLAVLYRAYLALAFRMLKEKMRRG